MANVLLCVFQIYDGITRLANTYVKICAAGSILFQQWKSTFYCEPDRAVCTMIDLGLSDRKLQGLARPGLDVCGHIQNTSHFLDQCLEDWLEHIKTQRTQYYYLNHYTTSQIVILRKEMAKIAFTKTGFSHYIYPMLRCVKDDCSEGDIARAIHAAFAELEAMEEVTTIDDDRDGKEMDDIGPSPLAREPEEDMEEEASDDREQMEEFIAKMEDSGFSRKLAVQALLEFNSDQVEEGEG